MRFSAGQTSSQLTLTLKFCESKNRLFVMCVVCLPETTKHGASDYVAAFTQSDCDGELCPFMCGVDVCTVPLIREADTSVLSIFDVIQQLNTL